jgi:hypothetical protein
MEPDSYLVELVNGVPSPRSEQPENERFTLRAFLINVLTEPHHDGGSDGHDPSLNWRPEDIRPDLFLKIWSSTPSIRQLPHD